MSWNERQGHKDAATGGFDEWVRAVDAICRAHLACGWADLCGDLPPLQTAFEAGESPVAFVRRWAEKYDLEWCKPLGPQG